LSNRRLRVGVRLSVTVLLVAIAIGADMLLERMRHAAVTAATVGLEQAAKSAEAAVNRHFLQVDSTLAGLPAMLRTAAAGRPLEPAMANAVLRDLNVQNLVFRDVLLVQPGGRIWASSLASSRQGGLSLETHLLEARPVSGSLIVAGPLRNPATSEWAIFFARPLNLPGVGRVFAAIEVPVQLITGLLTPMGDAARVRIALEREDGEVLATVPHDETVIGRAMPRPPAFRADGTAFQVRDPVTAVRTIEVARPALYRSIQLRVTRDSEDALADWRRDRHWLMIVAGGAATLLVCLALAMDLSLTQREKMEAERAKARATLENAIEAMPDGFVMWDAQDRLVTCNRRFREIYRESGELLVPGVTFEALVRGGVDRGQYPQCGADVDDFVRGIIAWRRDDGSAFERLLPDGQWLLVSERPTPDGGHVGIRTDITPIKRAMADLAAETDRAEEATAAARVQGERLHAALENMSQGLCMVGADQRVIVCNRRFIEIFGVAPEAAAPGTPADALFATLRASAGGRGTLERRVQDRQRALARAGQGGSFTVEENDRALAVAHCPMPDGGWVATYEDVTERAHAEAKVRFMAHHDALTRLPNRVLFRDRLDQAIGEMAEEGSVALLCLDLDRFKQVNDTLGHPAGDQLLIAAAQRLRGCVRESDFVARLGGDEFAIVHRSTQIPYTAQLLARRIIETLAAPYDIGGNRAAVGVSVGIAVAGGEQGGTDADTLLKNADVALYRAKSQGRGTFCLYDQTMGSAALRRLGMEADLREALAEEQFRLVYQPVRDLAHGGVTGFEALVRWSHPDLGQVSPAEFIPLAEDSGLILKLGDYILRTACTAAVQWPAGMRLAVNLSPVQLRHAGLAESVANALSESGLRAERLELEITETALLQESDEALEVLRQLRAMGVGIALDDFGTGYSSLRHLTSLPVDRIKIDRSFVSGLGTRQDCRAIVSSVASLAGQLGLAVTAEGVETAEQLRMVQAAGCNEAQGYFISKPIALGDATALANGEDRRAAA
jgi:diguanylate cyclase (GGDEF)-like protein